eukprot:Opistho-2@49117
MRLSLQLLSTSNLWIESINARQSSLYALGVPGHDTAGNSGTASQRSLFPFSPFNPSASNADVTCDGMGESAATASTASAIRVAPAASSIAERGGPMYSALI